MNEKVTVYIVMVEDSAGYSTTIHSTYANEHDAESIVDMLNSQLGDDLIATIEPQEVI